MHKDNTQVLETVAGCELAKAGLAWLQWRNKLDQGHAFRSAYGMNELKESDQQITLAAARLNNRIAHDQRYLTGKIIKRLTPEQTSDAMHSLLKQAAKNAHQRVPYMRTVSKGYAAWGHVMNGNICRDRPDFAPLAADLPLPIREFDAGRGMGANSTGAGPQERALVANPENLAAVIEETIIHQLRWFGCHVAIARIVESLDRLLLGTNVPFDFTPQVEWAMVVGPANNRFLASLEKAHTVARLYPEAVKLHALLDEFTARMTLPHIYGSDVLVNDVVAFVDPRNDDQAYSGALDEVLMRELETRCARLAGIAEGSYKTAAQINAY